MKTYQQCKTEVEKRPNSNLISESIIEQVAAKLYAKHWLDQAAEVAMLQAEKGLPVGDAIYALKDEIDKQS